jgi:hypothetical protein
MEELLEKALERLGKSNVHGELLAYLHSEWVNTLEDLSAGSCVSCVS